MPLGKEVGLGPGHIVLDGDPVGTLPPFPYSSPSPLFGPCLLWPNGRPSQQLLSSCLAFYIWGAYCRHLANTIESSVCRGDVPYVKLLWPLVITVVCWFISVLFLAEKVSFIDFEYAGYNYQAHDIAMHFCDYPGNDCSTVISRQCWLVYMYTVSALNIR